MTEYHSSIARNFSVFGGGLCVKGRKYDTKLLKYWGWHGDGVGRNQWTFFDKYGQYLGPDESDTEPLFSLPSILQAERG